MPKVKLTVTQSNCRCGYFKEGDEFIIEDLCPPICHELWHSMYPSIYVILNGGTLDYGNEKQPKFDIQCPDHNRVTIHGEVLSD